MVTVDVIANEAALIFGRPEQNIGGV